MLGLAVDLRWFEPAWGPGLAVFSKILLLDAGIYGFLVIRQLSRVGFDLRLRPRDVSVGLLAFVAYRSDCDSAGVYGSASCISTPRSPP